MSHPPAFVTGHPSSGRAPRRGRDGFALLITITLLAFLVLLLVSLAALTRVETQVAGNNQQLAQARQNAVLALNIALGELQKYAGPDQRATAPADIGTALDGTRQWTGVWGNASNPQGSSKSTPALLQWLVSGNQGTAFNGDTAVSATQASFGQITTTPPGQTFTPDKPVAGFTAGSPATAAVTINGVDAILLAGTGSAGTASTTGYVAAPLVNIKVAPSQIPGASSPGADIRIGRYAYWVGDEGVKARFNTVDPNVTPTSAMTAAGIAADTASAYRLMSPQRFGVELVDGYAQYPVNSASLRTVVDQSQAGLIVPGLSTQARQAAFHDLTAVSFSVLSDQLHGGLKRDLTYAFARNSLQEYRSLIRDPQRTVSLTAPNPLLSGVLDTTVTDTPAVTDSTLIAEQGPTWEQLRSFARLGADINYTGLIQPRIQTGENQGVYPVLAQTRLGFVGGKTVDASDSTKQRFIFRLSPVFVLANPYNVTIAAGKYRVRAIFDSSGAGYGVYLGSNVDGTVRTPIWRKTLRELFDGQVYELNCKDLAPGQARLFTLSQDETWLPQKTYQFDNEWAETMISLDTGAEVTDDDIKTYGLHAVFSDTGTQNSWRPNGTINAAGATDGTITWALTGASDAVYQRFSNFVARGSGASVYDGGFFNSTGQPKDDPEVRGYFMFKLGESGHFKQAGELNQVDIYPYYALGNIRAPMVGRPNWYKDKTIFNTLTFAQVFSKSVNKERYQHWLRFGSSDPATSAEVEWQGVLKVGSMGNSTPSLPQAQMRWPMADLPREPDGPVSGLVSLGQLQHFNAGGYNDGQTFPSASDLVTATVRPSNNESWRARHIGNPNPIGNSRANPFVRRDLVRSQWPANITREPFHDQSYLLNRELFDGYFFSTYPQNFALAVDLNTRRLANSSFLPFRSDIAAGNPEAFRGKSSVFNASDVLLPARNLIQRGGFNINSTSVAAWRALLGSLGGASFNGETGLTGPFVRSIRQSGGSTSADSGLSQNSWSGFRNLTPAQIDTLATELVAQIKRRGPAVSLADFINRKLVADTAANAQDGLAGPIQAAIDASGINSALTKQIKNWDSIDADITTLTAAALYPYPSHLPVHPLEGIAGWLSQADVVQALAPILTARSDTFRIRAYGETRNPATDERVGQAWCEAIVQRLPDYIVPADNDAIATGTALTPNNRQFGRKFVVTGFRWLAPEEI